MPQVNEFSWTFMSFKLFLIMFLWILYFSSLKMVSFSYPNESLKNLSFITIF